MSEPRASARGGGFEPPGAERTGLAIQRPTRLGDPRNPASIGVRLLTLSPVTGQSVYVCAVVSRESNGRGPARRSTDLRPGLSIVAHRHLGPILRESNGGQLLARLLGERATGACLQRRCPRVAGPLRRPGSPGPPSLERSTDTGCEEHDARNSFRGGRPFFCRLSFPPSRP